jgi:hypothetical protein
VLVLLSPGVQARMYLVGLVDAARRLEIPHAAVELKPLWDHVRSAGDAGVAAGEIARDLSALVRRERFTHVLGYGYNGVELGRVHTPTSTAEPLFPSLGLRHLMLWTDHPNWMAEGIALHPVMRRVLANGRHAHFVKSEGAAAEAARVLGWPNIHALAMGEAYDLLPPAAAREPEYDAAVIWGAAPALPEYARPFLDSADPDPAEIDAAGAAAVLEGWPARAPGGLGIEAAAALLEAKGSRPLDALFRIAGDLPGAGRGEC